MSNEENLTVKKDELIIECVSDITETKYAKKRFIVNKVLFDLPSAKYKSISKTDLSMSKMVIADHEDQDTITSLKDIYLKIRFKNQTKIKLKKHKINTR